MSFLQLILAVLGHIHVLKRHDLIEHARIVVEPLRTVGLKQIGQIAGRELGADQLFTLAAAGDDVNLQTEAELLGVLVNVRGQRFPAGLVPVREGQHRDGRDFRRSFRLRGLLGRFRPGIFALRRLLRIARRGRSLFRATSDQRCEHHQRKQQCKNLFHDGSSCFVVLRGSLSCPYYNWRGFGRNCTLF